MEVKKSEKADLQSKKFIFTQVGLFVSLAILYGLFNMHTSNIEIAIVQKEEEPVVMEAPPITRPEEAPKPRVQKVVAPTISEKFEVVENTVELEDTDLFNPETDEDTPNYAGLPTGTPNDGEAFIEEDVPVFKAEINPDFQGGGAQSNNKFRIWVQKNVKYPKLAEENGVSGAVNIQFVIGQDGVIRDIKVISSPDRSLSDEVIRVLKSSPKWTPGKQREKPVSVIGTIRIVFNIGA